MVLYCKSMLKIVVATMAYIMLTGCSTTLGSFSEGFEGFSDDFLRIHAPKYHIENGSVYPNPGYPQ